MLGFSKQTNKPPSTNKQTNKHKALPELQGTHIDVCVRLCKYCSTILTVYVTVQSLLAELP